MRITFRRTLICLLAVFAVGAVASASASAAFKLEWQTCQEKAGGKFENHGCVKEGTTKTFEWETLGAGVTKKVTSKIKSATFVLTVGTKIITCKSATDKGAITGGSPGTDEATTIEFDECKTTETTCLVKSAGSPAKAGIIIVTNIKTKLVKGTSKAPAEVVADEFAGKGAEEEFVKLEFGEKENATTKKLETPCAGGKYPSPTTVKGKVYAIVGTSSLTFPTGGLKAPLNTLEAFTAKAELVGEEEETLENGWAIRAI
jgi:hypothetical protein